MAKQLQAYHASTIVSKIMRSVCEEMAEGTCHGAKTQPGTAQHTFGRLFKKTPVGDQATLEQLEALASRMDEGDTDITEGEGEAGMAFVGQFIDHDLTLDATTSLGTPSSPVGEITNFRTPRLDLDCVYGGGPEVSPWLYDGPRLLFGRETGQVAPAEGRGHIGGNPLDLARNRVGTALIGDPRNDENLFLSQVHGRQFVARHNELVDSEPGTAEHRFEHAREELTKEYHHRVVNEFLPQVVHPDVLKPLLANATEAGQNGQKYLSQAGGIDWKYAPDMPVEFSGAVFRFGHTWIRQFYHLNNNPGREAVAIFANPDDADAIDLRGFDPVATENNMQIELFFGESAQRAARIDTKIPNALIELPAEVVGDAPKIERNLGFRNIRRGQHTFELPTGEQCAEYMGFKPIKAHTDIVDLKLEGKTPLWFYALSEAEQNGFLLHNVGGTLVAGVLLNLMLRARSPIFFAPTVGV